MSTDRVLVSVWFDTEDYSDPPSDDAAMRLADILTDLKTTGTFKLVGEKLRELERRGRQDVIAAMGKQDIGYHTDWHSKHPTVPEYLEGAGWDDGVRLFIQNEGAGISDIQRIYGQLPSCHGQAGAAWAPQTYAACREVGIPVYLDDGGGNHLKVNDVSHWYCGLLCVESLGKAIVHPAPRTGRFLENTTAAFDVAMDHAKQTGGGVVGIYSHEVEFSHAQFADGLNFPDGRNVSERPWIKPPVRSNEDVEDSYVQFREFVSYVKSRPDTRIVSPAEFVNAFADRSGNRRYNLAETVEIAKAFLDAPGYLQVSDGWLSAAEVFALVLRQLEAVTSGSTRNWVTPSGWLGPKGLVSEAYQAEASVAVDDLLDTVKPTLAAADAGGAIPALISVLTQAMTPEAYLAACCRVLIEAAAGEINSKRVTGAFKRLDAERYIKDDGPEIWKWLFAPGFSAPHMMKLAKRQAWTIKPARLG